MSILSKRHQHTGTAHTNTALGMTARSSLELLHTDSAPRRTKVLSTLACALSIAPASRVGSGPRAGSISRPSPASSGRSLDGPHHQSPSPLRSPRRRGSLPRAPSLPMAAAARRTRSLSPSRPRATATPTASLAGTSRCRAPRVSRPARRHPCLSLQAPRGCRLPVARSVLPSRLPTGVPRRAVCATIVAWDLLPGKIMPRNIWNDAARLDHVDTSLDGH